MIKTIKIFILATALLTLAPYTYADYPQYPQCYQDCKKWGIKLLGHEPTDELCFNQCSIDCSQGHQGCIKLCHKIKREHPMLWFVNCKNGCQKACVAVD
ncbi:MAG: hypothetical protein CMF55_07195 [Legionellales bacterium]|nr:hypothetical protein [Legionellales bacterium]HAG62340.1 hypothetical protein [Coxiellaceae bacterium]